MNTSIGDKIRILRTIRGYSQKGLAILSGLKQENISYLESNKFRKKIDEEKLNRIAKALNVTVQELEKMDVDRLSECSTKYHDGGLSFSDPFLSKSEEILFLQREVVHLLQRLNQLYGANFQEKF